MEETVHKKSVVVEEKREVERLRLRIFRDALIFVFVNENCCLCKCFTELHCFY